MAWKYWNKSDDDESMYDIGFSDSDPDEKGGPQSYVYKMQQQKFELFKLQNPENFDVKFEIEGKILYASKFDLIAVSQTMNSWLSDRWTTKDQSVIIETYTFDIFYQFLCFIYSGGCELTKENIFEIIDVAEFFDLQHLKDFCETFLMQKKSEIVDDENIFEMVDVAEKYSLTKFIKVLDAKIVDDIDELIGNENFLKVKKPSLLRLCQGKSDYASIPQKMFSALYKWAEYQAQTKKAAATKDENFGDIDEVIAKEFNDFMPFFKDLDADFIVSNVYETRFLFPISHYVNSFSNCNGLEDTLFQAVYETVEARALKKQRAKSNRNFVFFDLIKNQLTDILPVAKFSDMGIDFVIEFVVQKSFLFSSKELLKILAECYRHDDNQEEKLFKAMYQIAKTEVLQKQQKNFVPNLNFNVAIKNELAEFLPLIKFYLMDKKFLMEFVVGKGIITHEEAFENKIIKVEIKSGNRSLIGIFEDKLNITEIVGKNSGEVISYNTMKQRFIRLKFLRPQISSVLKKGGETEWYLCLEWEGTLAAKHRTLIVETDYLIAKLKCEMNNGYFRIQKNGNTKITVTSL